METKTRRCRRPLKSVNAACVEHSTVVSVPLRSSLYDELERAQRFIAGQPQRIREVQQAANAVLKAARKQGAKR